MWLMQWRHPDDARLLTAMDGECSARAARRMARHLESCDRCRGRVAELRRAAEIVATDQLAHPLVDDATLAAMRASLSRTLAQASAARDWRQVAVAASVICCLGAALWAIRSHVNVPAAERSALPIASLTPGAVHTIDRGQLCAHVDGDDTTVPATVRDRVLAGYRMLDVPASQYELDYLITPALGGAADVRNIWPQRYDVPTWNARVKDQLEDLLPALVCRGDLTLETAQHDMAADWIAAYKKYFHVSRPLASPVAQRPNRPAILLASSFDAR
jgi:anti-sigma factor RsiW